ncbi:hypothetical protein [Bradyrhizobium sp.]|uniref:hypothetical protein n=1 Tax=Bradyrhizobium sp. TaxID=376 RepID=UPI00403849DB
MQRRRFEQATSTEERLVQEAEHAKAEAETLPPGAERDLLLKKARQTKTAAHIDKWVDSPGLRPPK